MRLELNLPDLPDVPPGWLVPAAWAAGGVTAYLLAGAVVSGLCYRHRRRGNNPRSLEKGYGTGEDLIHAFCWPVPALTMADTWLLPALRVLLWLPSRPFVWVARLAAGRD
jgi:hypothetical protein